MNIGESSRENKSGYPKKKVVEVKRFENRSVRVDILGVKNNPPVGYDGNPEDPQTYITTIYFEDFIYKHQIPIRNVNSLICGGYDQLLFWVTDTNDNDWATLVIFFLNTLFLFIK